MKINKISKLLLIGFLVILTGTSSFARDKQTTDYTKFISIHDTSFKHTIFDNGNSHYIVSFGYLKNTSNVPLKDIVIEVQYYNADNIMIDTITSELYSTVILPSKDVSFKVSNEIVAKKKEYVSSSVKILSTDPKFKCESGNWIIDFIVWLIPLVILALVWIFLFKKHNGKGSNLAQSVEIMKNNNELIVKQNELFERLVVAIEKKNKKPNID